MRATFALFFIAAGGALAQGPEAAGVRGEVPGTRKRLADAEQLLLANKPGEARDAILKVLDDAGDDLILVEGGRYVSARWFAQRLLARLPAEQLNSYRDRVDDAAKKLLDDGRTDRDPRPLQELIEKHFVSRPAADALKLLGEFALERGEFALAEAYWSRLLSDAPAEDRYPGPISDEPLIRARIALAVHWQGEPERAGKLFQEFRKAHVDAAGRLAGREGKLVDLLREELTKSVPRLAELSTDRDWTTLGATAARSGFVPGDLKLLSITPLWTAPIPGRDPDAGPIIRSARNVAFHPAFDEKNVYLADGECVYRFDLAAGKSATLFDSHKWMTAAVDSAPALKTKWRDADFALTLAHGRLFVRLGEVNIPGDANTGNALTSHLACLDLRGDPDWLRRPPVVKGILAAWEGAPLVARGRIFAAFSRVEGGRLVQAISCYSDRGEKPLWVTDVCELGIATAENRERHELLTLAGPNVVFASQSGVVAAVNLRTGKPAWSYRYPRIARSSLDGRYRDISPAVASEGRVFVAPNDCDRLFCFDAENGRLLWQSEPILVDHLIGVAGSRVIAAIAGPQRGLRAYHTRTGSCDPPFGWKQHDDPNLPTFGRGLIAGDLIAWPTQAGLCLIRLQDGYLARPLLRGVHGNLAYANGKLAVASPKTLTLFEVPRAGPTPEPPLISMTPNQVDLATFQQPAKEPSLPPMLANPPTLTPMGPAQESRIFESPPVPVVRLDEHHLAGINAKSHAFDWILDGTKRTAFHPYSIASAPRFDEAFLADTVVAAHLSSGRCWLIEPASGKILRDMPCDSGPWIAPPARIDDHRVAIPTGPGAVTVVEIPSLKTSWTFDAPGSAGLAGVAPQMRRNGDFLDVLIARNHGCELHRLDSKGQGVWNSPAFFDTTTVSIQDSAADSQRLYLPLPNCVVTLRSDSGKQIWVANLPAAGRWSLHALGNALAAIPRSGNTPTAKNAATAYAKRLSPVGLLQVSMTLLESDRQPILILDPDTGQIRHKLADYDGPIIAVTVRADGLWLATPRTIYRLK